MGKFTEKSLLSEIMDDTEGKKILKKAFPLAAMHPRFNEGLTYSLEEIIEDNMATMVGITNEKLKSVLEKIYNLK